MSLVMTAAEIAMLLGGQLVGDGSVQVRGLAKIEEAGPDQLTFIANRKYQRYLDSTQAGVVLVTSDLSNVSRTVIVVNDPYLSFLRLLERFHPRVPWMEPGVHSTAVIDPTAKLAENVTVGALSYVGPRCVIGRGTVIYPRAALAADVVVGENCEIHSGVTLCEGVRMGNRVTIHDGAVIGSDGFGFVFSEVGYEKIPQLGKVVIHDDVEIGANATIDRATLGETVIGRGTKLDNLVHVAHNVTIGQHTVMAAQTGVSGSTRIGDFCRVGGQVGVVGHLRIGDRVQIGAQSGVSSDVPEDGVVSGSPARPHNLWKRIEASITRLPDLYRRVRALESIVLKTPKKSEAES